MVAHVPMVSISIPVNVRQGIQELPVKQVKSNNYIRFITEDNSMWGYIIIIIII